MAHTGGAAGGGDGGGGSGGGDGGGGDGVGDTRVAQRGRCGRNRAERAHALTPVARRKLRLRLGIICRDKDATEGTVDPV